MLSEKQRKKKEWRQKNREKIRAYDKEYCATHKRHRQTSVADKMHRRNTCISIGDGKVYGLIKRTYEGYCELCGKVVGGEIRVVDYHHWDDSDIEPGKKVKGLWVCCQCHRLCELVDKDYIHLIPRYLRLKRALNRKQKIEEELRPQLN